MTVTYCDCCGIDCQDKEMRFEVPAHFFGKVDGQGPPTKSGTGVTSRTY